MSTNNTNKLLRLLPNLLTTIGLFAGFYAMVAAVEYYYSYAAIAIIIAGIADTLDGRLACKINVNSEFGIYYDSLVDAVAFAVAPAMVMYLMFLYELTYLGFAIAFSFIACGIFRLARFNATAATEDKTLFKGLPSTSAAGMMATIIWVAEKYHTDSLWLVYLVALITFSIALLMISELSYASINGLERKHIPFAAALVIGIIIVAIFFNLPEILLIIGGAYVFGVPEMALKKRFEK